MKVLRDQLREWEKQTKQIKKKKQKRILALVKLRI
ncbi:unnamed protein product [Bacillus thuringiensis DB27]|uniref:Uncharacterized protein n=1 Tax=Bacillus thuringiensis DB27 TaxID=1431339 RepID=W8YW03_BACTU|nr:unnamed protein product [Bacillus thuringiensis DB27]